MSAKESTESQFNNRQNVTIQITIVALVIATTAIVGGIFARCSQEAAITAAKQWDRGEYQGICPPIGVFCDSQKHPTLCKKTQDIISILRKDLRPHNLFRYNESGKVQVYVVPATEAEQSDSGFCGKSFDVFGVKGELHGSPSLVKTGDAFHAKVCTRRLDDLRNVQIRTLPNSDLFVIDSIKSIGYEMVIGHELLHVIVGGRPGKYHPTSDCGILCSSPYTLLVGTYAKEIINRVVKQCAAR